MGIVGTNFISEWFTDAARRTNGRLEPVAVYSRSAERAEAFARAQGLETAVDDLDALIDVVDAVYVASPTIAHYGQAMRAIEAGRHVLVEKTFTASYAEAEHLFAEADARDVVAMEATRHLHTPDYALFRDAIARVGTVRYAQFEMLQYSSRYDRFRAGVYMNAFDPSLANSALADIGVYCLEPAIDLFGIPSSHTGSSIRFDNGFEASGSILLDYRTMLVDAVYSKICEGIGPSTVVGELGALTIDSLSHPSRIALRDRSGESVLFDVPKPRPQDEMHYELFDFADQIQAGATDPRWKNVTLATRRIMDEHLERTTP